MGTFCCICIAEVSRHMGPYMINLLLKLHIGIVDISETVLQLPRDSKLISLQIYIYQEFIIVTIVSPIEQSLINKNIYIYIYSQVIVSVPVGRFFKNTHTFESVAVEWE